MALPSDAYWTDAERELADILMAHLMSAGKTGAQQALTGLGDGVGVDFELVNTAVEKWARSMSLDLVKGITETSRDSATRTIGDWIGSGKPLPALTSALEPMFGANRADLISSTEATRAFQEGNVAAWKESGVVNKIKWQTAVDERVCPICGPLAGKVDTIDGNFGGHSQPPAHPRCRCWTLPVVNLPSETQPTAPGDLAAQEARAKIADWGQLIAEKDAALIRQIEALGPRIQSLMDADVVDEKSVIKLWKQVNSLQAERNKLHYGDTAQQIRETVVNVTDPLRSKLNIATGTPKALADKWKAAQADFLKMVSRTSTADGKNVWAELAKPGGTGVARASAYYDARSIYLMPGSGPSTVIHELGHWLEDFDSTIHKKALDFLIRRTTGETAESLKSIYPNSNYDLTEMTMRDKFWNAYCGKLYGGARATEIVSMGMERMYSDPAGFAQSDPDYFDLIYKIVRGL